MENLHPDFWIRSFSKIWGFPKWWVSPTTIGFPTKNDHFGVFWGYHHLRKHPYVKKCMSFWWIFQPNPSNPYYLTATPQFSYPPFWWVRRFLELFEEIMELLWYDAGHDWHRWCHCPDHTTRQFRCSDLVAVTFGSSEFAPKTSGRRKV